MWILDETSLSIIFGCTFQLMIPGGTCHLTKVVTLTIREKVVIGIMQKIHSRQSMDFRLQSKIYCKVINLLNVQLQSMNKLVSGQSKKLITLIKTHIP